MAVISLASDFDNIQIRVGTESPVEAQFFLAVEPATVRGGEVKKAQIDVFFYFINMLRSKVESGNVGFPEGDRPCLPGVSLDVEHGFMQGLGIHRHPGEIGNGSVDCSGSLNNVSPGLF